MGQEVTLSGFVHQSPDIGRAQPGATNSLLRDRVGDSTKGGDTLWPHRHQVRFLRCSVPSVEVKGKTHLE